MRRLIAKPLSGDFFDIVTFNFLQNHQMDCKKGPNRMQRGTKWNAKPNNMGF